MGHTLETEPHADLGPRALLSFPTASDRASRLRSLLVRNCLSEAVVQDLGPVLLVRVRWTVNFLMAFSLRFLGADTRPAGQQDGLGVAWVTGKPVLSFRRVSPSTCELAWHPHSSVLQTDDVNEVQAGLSAMVPFVCRQFRPLHRCMYVSVLARHRNIWKNTKENGSCWLQDVEVEEGATYIFRFICIPLWCLSYISPPFIP